MSSSKLKKNLKIIMIQIELEFIPPFFFLFFLTIALSNPFPFFKFKKKREKERRKKRSWMVNGLSKGQPKGPKLQLRNLQRKPLYGNLKNPNYCDKMILDLLTQCDYRGGLPSWNPKQQGPKGSKGPKSLTAQKSQKNPKGQKGKKGITTKGSSKQFTHKAILQWLQEYLVKPEPCILGILNLEWAFWAFLFWTSKYPQKKHRVLFFEMRKCRPIGLISLIGGKD